MNDSSIVDHKRLYWHSRRGMLELDLMLVPFAQEQLEQLGAAELASYRDLLAQEDQDLYAWLVGRGAAPDERLQAMVERIRAHARCR